MQSNNIDSPIVSVKREYPINLETNPCALQNRKSVHFQTFLKGLKKRTHQRPVLPNFLKIQRSSHSGCVTMMLRINFSVLHL